MSVNVTLNVGGGIKIETIDLNFKTQTQSVISFQQIRVIGNVAAAITH